MPKHSGSGAKRTGKGPSVRTLPDIDPSDASTFILQYVKARQPGIIRSLPADLLPLTRYADTYALVKAAQNAVVLVEPRDEKKGQHGTAVKRRRMGFGEFLTELGREEGSNLYLTTQYEEEHDGDNRHGAGVDGDSDGAADDGQDVEGYEAEARACFPEPIRSVLSSGTSSIPIGPTIAQSLVLQQMNIWIGRSSSGSSSGLHHDYHDNLYILLRGRKRFILYPPRCARYLSPHGQVHKVRENGLIVYEGYEGTGEDGLDRVDRARWRVKALEREIGVLREKVDGKQGEKEGKKRLKKLEEAYEEAVEEHLGLLMDVQEGDDFDDFDALDGVDDFDNLDDLDALDNTRPTKRTKQPAEDEPKKRAKTDSRDEEPREPDSFSKISSAQLHAYLDLPPLSSSANRKPAPPIPPKRLAKLQKAGRPIIVDLKAGDMLYLPASWWHEVTSYGVSSTKDEIKLGTEVRGEGDDTHIAFNYWFHPPSDLDEESKGLYKDGQVWGYIQEEVSKEYERLVGTEST